MAGLGTRTLGRTGLNVTVLGFGAMELRGPGAAIRNGKPFEPEQAERVLNLVLDHGVNFVDTSIDYGQSEEMIGKYIAHRRDEYFLASKCGCNVDTKAVEAGTAPRHIYTRQNIVDGVEQSLKRMHTDHLDVLQFHGGPPEDARDEAVQTMLELKAQGKTRFIGVSDALPGLANFLSMDAFDAFQFPYSALEQEHEPVMAQAARAGVGTIIRGGIARGEPGRGLAEPSRWAAWEEADLDELLEGMDRFEFLLRFTIGHSALNTTIIGTLDPLHAERNINAACRGPLPADVYAEAKRRLERLVS